MIATVLREFFDLLTQGLVRPRPVARIVIDRVPDGATRLMLVGLAVAMQGCFWAILSLIAPGMFEGAMAGGVGFGSHIFLAALAFANFAITATIAFWLGRQFGGTGSFTDIASAVAWHTVLASSLTPLQAVAFGMPGGAPFALLFMGLNIYLLAACLAEAHHFRSVARVAGAIMAVLAGLAFLLGALIALPSI